MARPPTLEELEHTVVVLTDAGGRRARVIVDRVANGRCVLSYVFHGQRPMPLECAVGDRIELGASSSAGWIQIEGSVEAIARSGSIIVSAGDVELVNRRRGYREELIVPFELRLELDDREPRRGRTENLSIGGFAARIEGLPVNDGREVLVSLSMPEGDDLHVVCEKLGGDIQQRFRFVHLDRRAEDRIARLIRAAELEKRRAGRARP